MKSNKYIEINFFHSRQGFLVGKGKSNVPVKGEKTIRIGIHIRNMCILKKISSSVYRSGIALDIYKKYLIKQKKYCVDSRSSVLYHNVPQCRTTIHIPFEYGQNKQYKE